MIRAIRPQAMAQDDAVMVTGWNLSPNVAYTLQLNPGSSACGVLLYNEGQTAIIASGAGLVGTDQPVILHPYSGQTLGMVDADLGWHLLLTTIGTESQRTIRIGPAVDLPDEIHPIYGDDALTVVRATAGIDGAAHYIDDLAVACPLGLGADLGDVVSVPVDGAAVVGQVESITWTGTPNGAIESAVIRRHVAIAPEAFVEPTPITPPTVADDIGTTDAATTTSGNVLANDEAGLTVVAVNGLSASVGVAVDGNNGGTFTIASNGAWTFDPDGDFALLTGAETADTSVTYHASDGVSEAMATLTVTVSVAAVETDPYWANVSVCINADDGIVDAKGHTLNLGGNVAVSNILGYQTIYFDGSGDHIAIPNFTGIELGAGDFCIDFMVKFANLGAYQVVYSKGANWGSAGGIIAFIYGDSVITHAFGNTTWLFQQNSNAPALSTSNLYHIAFSRHGNILRVFVDGSLRREATITGDGTSATTFPFVIGNDRDFNAPQSPMHITAFRITKGVPRYTAAFSPLPDKYFPTA